MLLVRYHIEFPTILQTEQGPLEDIGDENKPNGVFEQITSLFKPKDVDVEDTNNGNINNLVKKSREKAVVQFFINIGYSKTNDCYINHRCQLHRV